MEFLRGLDMAIFTCINSTLSHPWLDWFFPLITDLNHSWAFRIAAPLVVLGLLIWKWRKYSVIIFIGLLITLGVSDWTGSHIGKHYFERARPFQVSGLNAVKRSDAGGYSFPSNHSINTFAFAAYLTPFLPIWSALFYAIAVMTAYSRVYCGVHFPADVIVGAIWGIFLGVAFSSAIRRFLLKVRG